MSSPAERYAAARRRQAASRSELARFMAGYDFPFDDFQVRGCEALERSEGVLVAAPTGAGKTVVGEFAIHLALAKGLKAFYTPHQGPVQPEVPRSAGAPRSGARRSADR